jgi:hypothetical protein
MKKLIGLGLEQPPLRLGFAQRPDKPLVIISPDEQERCIQRAMEHCSRQKWLVKSQQDKADAVATDRTNGRS